MDLTQQGKNNVGIALFPAIQQFPDFYKPGLELLQLRWSEFYLPTGVRDFHETPRIGAGNIPFPSYTPGVTRIALRRKD